MSIPTREFNCQLLSAGSDPADQPQSPRSSCWELEVRWGQGCDGHLRGPLICDPQLAIESWVLEHLVPSWWSCLGRRKCYRLTEGRMLPQVDFEVQNPSPLPTHSLCFLLAIEDMSAQHPVPGRMGATCCHPSPQQLTHPSGTINRYKFFCKSLCFVLATPQKSN